MTLDRPRRLILNKKAIRLFTVLTGRQILSPSTWEKPSLVLTRAAFYALLKTDDPSLTVEGAGNLLTEANMRAVTAALRSWNAAARSAAV